MFVDTHPSRPTGAAALICGPTYPSQIFFFHLSDLFLSCYQFIFLNAYQFFCLLHIKLFVKKKKNQIKLKTKKGIENRDKIKTQTLNTKGGCCLSFFFCADGLPACLAPAARQLSGLRLLFLFVLLQEGWGAELLLLLGVG